MCTEEVNVTTIQAREGPVGLSLLFCIANSLSSTELCNSGERLLHTGTRYLPAHVNLLYTTKKNKQKDKTRREQGGVNALPTSVKGQGIPWFCGCTTTAPFCQKNKKTQTKNPGWFRPVFADNGQFWHRLF